MAQNLEDLRNKLIGYIEDAHALEDQIEQVLTSQLTLTQNHPEIQAKIRQHLAETQLQKKRMAQRLEAYNRTPSMIKNVVGNIQGTVFGAAAGLRGDALSRAMRDDYVTEHLEIAGYTLLITTAELVGDHETVKAARETLKEEIAMQEWLASHLAGSLVLDFQDQGVQLPTDSAKTVEAGPQLRVTFQPSVESEAKAK
jgi:ferritin-like metal-binding protein YciE